MKTINIYIIIITFFFGCSKETEKPAKRVNCGEIIRLWSTETAEQGNPCGNNDDYSRQYTFVVRNDISGNTKNFCVNISEYISYKLGSIYCDKKDPSGW